MEAKYLTAEHLSGFENYKVSITIVRTISLFSPLSHRANEIISRREGFLWRPISIRTTENQ